jgi:hypothetical protein
VNARPRVALPPSLWETRHRREHYTYDNARGIRNLEEAQ